MMTDKQAEVAARKLCELRGYGPETMVSHGAEPGPSGIVPAVLLHSPAWRLALREIRAAEAMEEALEAGRAA